MNNYEGRVPVRHFDLYRIECAEELELTGFAHYADVAGINMVEWSDRFPEFMPAECLAVKIVVCDPGRRFIFHSFGERYEKILREVAHDYIGG
jgi:tRNA threonylcarbamoyladenosine biosynthesis protein TsaE